MPCLWPETKEKSHDLFTILYLLLFNPFLLIEGDDDDDYVSFYDKSNSRCNKTKEKLMVSKLVKLIS